MKREREEGGSGQREGERWNRFYDGTDEKYVFVVSMVSVYALSALGNI